jgi:hypothetical protein
LFRDSVSIYTSCTLGILSLRLNGYYPSYFPVSSLVWSFKKWVIRFVEKIRHPDARLSLLSYRVYVFVVFKLHEVKR